MFQNLLALPSAREKENKKMGEEILDLLCKPTVKERSTAERFRSQGGESIVQVPAATGHRCPVQAIPVTAAFSCQICAMMQALCLGRHLQQPNVTSKSNYETKKRYHSDGLSTFRFVSASQRHLTTDCCICHHHGL